MTGQPTTAQTAVLHVLAAATTPLRRREVALAGGHDHAHGIDHRTFTACARRGWVVGSFAGGWTITGAGRAALAPLDRDDIGATARGALWCACGMRIVGRPYVDATNPPGSHGPYLCHACAVDHVRERPGDLTQASTHHGEAP